MGQIRRRPRQRPSIGAWTRLMIQFSIPQAILFAIALIILANSRPYEGLMLSIPLTLIFLTRTIRQSPTIFSGGAQHRGFAFLPFLAILTPAALAMGYYNARITGHPLRMPFMEYSTQYDIYPKFWFLPKHPPPTYSSAAVAQIHTDFEPGDYDLLQTPAGVLRISAQRLWQLLSMHARPWLLLLLPLAAAATLLRNPKIKLIYITLLIFFLGLCGKLVPPQLRRSRHADFSVVDCRGMETTMDLEPSHAASSPPLQYAPGSSPPQSPPPPRPHPIPSVSAAPTSSRNTLSFKPAIT